MPKLPAVSGTPVVSSQALRLPALGAPRDFAGAALGKLGETASVVADAFAKADDETKAQQAVFESTLRLQEADKEIRSSGDPATATQRYDESFSRILSEKQDKLSTGAYSSFAKRFQNHYLTSRASMGTYARGKQIEAGKAALDNGAELTLRQMQNPEVYSNPIIYGQTLRSYTDAVDAQVRTGVIAADDGEKRKRKIVEDSRKAAVNSWLNSQSDYTEAFRKLERNDTGDENLNALWADVPPDERVDIKRAALKAAGERAKLEKDEQDAQTAALEAIGEDLQRQIATETDTARRRQLMDRYERFSSATGTGKARDIMFWRDYVDSAGGTVGVRDNPAVLAYIEPRIQSGEFTVDDVFSFPGAFTQATTTRLINTAKAIKDQRISAGKDIIRNSFGILKDTAISDPQQAQAAAAAGQALVEYQTVMSDPQNKEDPVAAALRLSKQGTESIAEAVRRGNVQSFHRVFGQYFKLDTSDIDLTSEKAFTESMTKKLEGLSATDKANAGNTLDLYRRRLFPGGN